MNAAPAPWAGFATLLYKELLRFWRVSFQTVAAPVLTALLYLIIFGHVLEDRVQVYGHIPYTAFLVPGIAMMSMLQNAFANSSSSLIQSKVTGNIVRGLTVGTGVLAVTLPFVAVQIAHPLWAAGFALAGCAILGTMGVIAGIWAEKFDQLAGFQNFVVMPLTFLAGVFYSVHSLPAFWQRVSHLNPFFYMIDGFRYGFFGASDVDPATSLAISRCSSDS